MCAAWYNTSRQGCRTTEKDVIYVSGLVFRFLLSGCVQKAVLSFQIAFPFRTWRVFPWSAFSFGVGNDRIKAVLTRRNCTKIKGNTTSIWGTKSGRSGDAGMFRRKAAVRGGTSNTSREHWTTERQARGWRTRRALPRFTAASKLSGRSVPREISDAELWDLSGSILQRLEGAGEDAGKRDCKQLRNLSSPLISAVITWRVWFALRKYRSKAQEP